MTPAGKNQLPIEPKKVAANGIFEMSLATAGFVALVLIAIPQIQELRASNGAVRWAEALEMVSYLSPAITLQLYILIVALRTRYQKRIS